MNESLTKKLGEAGLLEEVNAALSEVKSAAVVEYMDSDEYKATLSAAIKSAVAPSSAEKEKVEEKPDCFGKYKKVFNNQQRKCRTCKYAKGCK